MDKCLPLFAANKNIFTLLYRQLKTDGKSFIFVGRDVMLNLSTTILFLDDRGMFVYNICLVRIKIQFLNVEKFSR